MTTQLTNVSAPRRLVSRLWRWLSCEVSVGAVFPGVLRPLFAAGVAAALLIVGGVLAHRGEFGGTYWHTWTPYVVSLGAGWSLYWFLWGVANVPEMMKSATVAVASDADGRAFADSAKRRIQSLPIMLILVWAASFATYVTVASHQWHQLPAIPGFSTESATWAREPHLWLKNLIVAIWAFPIIFGIGATASLALKYFALVQQFSRLDLVCSGPLLREGCRRVGRFALIGGSAWNAAVLGMAAALSAPQMSWPPSAHVLLPGATVVALSLFGVGGMLWPEFVLRPLLIRNRRCRIDELAKLFRSRVRRGPMPDVDDRIATIAAETSWVHGYAGAVTVAGGIVVPLATFVLGLLVQA